MSKRIDKNELNLLKEFSENILNKDGLIYSQLLILILKLENEFLKTENNFKLTLKIKIKNNEIIILTNIFKNNKIKEILKKINVNKLYSFYFSFFLFILLDFYLFFL